ncbi:hypothetical protein ACFYON_26560 [Micromonospora sp. NPDC005686]|uniref:hypothetical protein n=1 Tax=unclassified Micromonospora TaxID=2617518 RepID=UPI00367EAB0C
MTNRGSRDFFGGAVTAGCRPDRGAHQLTTTCAPGGGVVPRTGWSVRYVDSQETAAEKGGGDQRVRRQPQHDLAHEVHRRQ